MLDIHHWVNYAFNILGSRSHQSQAKCWEHLRWFSNQQVTDNRHSSPLPSSLRDKPLPGVLFVEAAISPRPVVQMLPGQETPSLGSTLEVWKEERYSHFQQRSYSFWLEEELRPLLYPLSIIQPRKLHEPPGSFSSRWWSSHHLEEKLPLTHPSTSSTRLVIVW